MKNVLKSKDQSQRALKKHTTMVTGTAASFSSRSRNQRAILEAYEDLANAIIVEAAVDYRQVRRKLWKKPFDKDLQAELRNITDFFYSEWFEVLSKADPKLIISKLEMESL